MVWLAVFGWILASRRRIHVRIRFFQDRLPQARTQGAELAIQSRYRCSASWLPGTALDSVGKNHDLEATTLPISMAWMYAPMVLAGAVTALQGVSELVEALLRWRAVGASGSGVERRMMQLMLEIVGVWLVAILVGLAAVRLDGAGGIRVRASSAACRRRSCRKRWRRR